MASNAKSRIGRPYPMGFRTTAEIRAKLEDAASKSGRSLSQEIEARLQSTFAEDRMRVIAREEALKAIADSRTVKFSPWEVVPASQQVLGSLNGPPAQRLNGKL